MFPGTISPLPAAPTSPALPIDPRAILDLNGSVSDDALSKSSFIKDISATNESILRQLPNGDRVVVKDFAAMFAFDESGFLDQKSRAENEVFAYRFDAQLGLDLVPETFRVQNDERKVVSRYIEGNGNELYFDRHSSSLYVFDYLLNVRDRVDAGGNIIYDRSGKAYAIDHESILEPGFKAIEKDTITDSHLDRFFEKGTTKDAFISTDWDEFISSHLKHRPREDWMTVKEEFLERIAFVEAKLLSGQSRNAAAKS